MSPHFQQGTSLVGLMLGMMVSGLVVLATAGTASYMQSVQRSSVNTDSATFEAAAALADIQREAHNTGLGVFSAGVMNCTSINAWYNGATIADNLPIAPASIVKGATDADSDEITFFSFSGVLAAAGQTLVDDMNNEQGDISLYNAAGLQENGMVMLATPGSTAPCTIGQVSNILDLPKGYKIKLNPGSDTLWNPPAPKHSFKNPVIYKRGSVIFSLPSGMRWTTYRVRNNQLQVTDRATGVTQVLADNIVALKAWYGVSVPGGAEISAWVPATGDWAGDLTADEIRRIRAIRVAAVAASGQVDKPAAGKECETTQQMPSTWEGGPAIDISRINSWRCMRFRAFSQAMVLNNVVFSGS